MSRKSIPPPGMVFILVGVLLGGAYSAAVFLSPKLQRGIIAGDAIRYYVYLRSAVFDRDLEFHNDYVALFGQHTDKPQPRWIHRPTVTGHAANPMSVGPAIFWAPLFLLASAVVWLVDTLGADYPLDGFGAVFQLSAAYGGILAATLGAYLTFRLCRRLFESESVAFWGTISTWLGSNALYYSLVTPTYSHACSIAAASIFFYSWVATLDDPSYRRFAWLGALGGLCALVRWQDAVFLVVLAIDAARGMWRPSIAQSVWSRVVRASLQIFVSTLAALAIFTPQIGAWLTLYGHPFVMPQGEGWMQWRSPQIVQVLFSDWHGLFTWTPLFLLAVIGLAWLARDRPDIAVTLGAVFLVSVYANAAVSQWWAGEAFGARRFVSLFPVFAIGLAAIYRRLGRRTIVMVSLAFIAYNGLLLLQYQANRHGLQEIAPYPSGFYGLVLAKFVVPLKLAAHLWARL